MRFRAVFANVLADLKFAQFTDQPRTQDDAQKQRRQTGERRAKRDEAERRGTARTMGYSCP